MRLIDADALILRYQSHPDRHSKDYLSYITYEDVLDAVIYDLEREATVDAVPVVRCKDCKHKPSGTGVNHDIEFPDETCPCQCDDDWYSWMPEDNWFCADGERREDEAD